MEKRRPVTIQLLLMEVEIMEKSMGENVKDKERKKEEKKNSKAKR
jgi:hypothetical protein